MKTITWSIEKLQVLPSQSGRTNAVAKAFWKCEVVNGEASNARVGVCEFVLGDTFIPYSQLTEQQVLDWCFEPKTTTEVVVGETITVTKNLKQDTEAEIDASIARQLAQKESEPALPWKNVSNVMMENESPIDKGV
jgi:hypothetical protein